MDQAELKTYAAMAPIDERRLEANSSYAQILALIDGPKRVVDFGCGPGNLARFLSRRGCSIVGVDINPDHASMAREYCEDVLVADLDSVNLNDLFHAQRFDVAIFSDILEHLRNPARLMAQITAHLSPGGCVIASIPNVAHGAVRLALLDGDFEYQSLGVLDDTHVRFFTRKSVETFFEKAGLLIDHVSRTMAPIFEPTGTLVPAVDPKTVPDGVLEKLRNDPDIETLQFIVRASPVGVAPRGASKRRVAWLERRVQDLEGKLSAAETELAEKLDVPSRRHLSNVLERLHTATIDLENERSAAESAMQALGEAQERLDVALRDAAEHSQQRARLTGEIQQLGAALEIAGADRTKLEVLLANANESLEFERQRAEQHVKQIIRLQDILQNQVEQVNAAAAERDLLASDLREQAAQTRVLQERLSEAVADRDEVRQHHAHLSAELQQLASALEMAGSEKAKVDALLANSNEALDFERQRIEQRDKQTLRQQAILQNQVEQVNTVTSERDSLLARLAQRARDIALLEDRLARAVAESSEMREKAETETQVLRAQVREAALRAEKSEFYLDAMRKSKFWQIRNAWFRIKGAFGVTTDIP